MKFFQIKTLICSFFLLIMSKQMQAQVLPIIDSSEKDTIGIWQDLMKMQRANNFPINDLKTAYNDLFLLKVVYLSLDKKQHEGVLLVHKDLAVELKAIFNDLLRDSFLIEKIMPANKFPLAEAGGGWNDDAIMENNVTSSFNFRYKTNGSGLSLHALGRAIDINPLFNPYESYFDNGKFLHPKNAFYDQKRTGTISDANIVKYFEKRGWEWAGRWGNPVDFQHFQKKTSKRNNKILLLKHNSLKDLFYSSDTATVFFANAKDKEVFLSTKKLPATAFMVKEREREKFGDLCKHYSSKFIDSLLKTKGNKTIDNVFLSKFGIDTSIFKQKNGISKGLKGKKIALDPGHFAKNEKEALMEQKFICDEKGKILFYESELNYAVALLLKKELEAQGASVLLTRKAGENSLGQTISSYLASKNIDLSHFESVARYNEFKTDKAYIAAKNAFSKEDLAARSEKINAFKPDITLCIHFNVSNETANNWEAGSTKSNYNMVFVAGAFGENELNAPLERLEFARLLATKDLDNSLLLAKEISASFGNISATQIIPSDWHTPSDNYLENYCTASDFKGVFHRNLGITRQVHGVVCYGETLFQNNKEEAARLQKCEDKTQNKRVQEIAYAYFMGISAFFGL